MISALKAAASGMEAQMAQIDNISNNLANVNTTGFKKSRAEFQDLLYETLQEPGANTSALTQAPVGIQKGMGVKVAGTQRVFEMGTPQNTKRELDFMIKGEGFFAVQLPNGDTGYRRDGTFYRSANGRVETLDGYPLIPEISVPSGVRSLSVSEDGTVTGILSDTQRSTLGQIQVATFSNNSGLKSIGKNLFSATEGSGPASMQTPGSNNSGSILQYYLESSNVDMMREMTDMISAQRSFEMNSKVMQTVDQMLQHTVSIR